MQPVEADAAIERYLAARATLDGWIAGAFALSLIDAASAAGIFEATRERSTLTSIANRLGLPLSRVASLCRALAIHGVVRSEGDLYELAPDFAAVSDPNVIVDLADLLGWATEYAHCIRLAADATVPQPGLTSGNWLAIAAAAGSPTSLMVAAASARLGLVPELMAAWRNGAHHLELGCGVAVQLLASLVAHPSLSAVGVEHDPVVAAEARRRAAAMGVADRLEIRDQDAAEVEEKAAFDTAFWSQPFFAATDRAGALGAAHRALKVGGILVEPVFWYPLEGSIHGVASVPERARAQAIAHLVHDVWGAPILTFDELRAELEASGFDFVQDVTIEPLPPPSVLIVSHYLVATRP